MFQCKNMFDSARTCMFQCKNMFHSARTISCRNLVTRFDSSEFEPSSVVSKRLFFHDYVNVDNGRFLECHPFEKHN